MKLKLQQERTLAKVANVYGCTRLVDGRVAICTD